MTANNDYSSPVVGWFVVEMLSFLVKNLAGTILLPGDFDIFVQVAVIEVDNIHRVIGDGLWAEFW